MKRAAAAALAALLAAGAGAETGSIAPAFELPGTAGTMKLADFRGKPVYIDFWASWCGPCRQSFPWMNALPARFSAHGLQVIGINLDTKEEDARRFLAATPAQFTVVFDPAGTTPRSYGIKGMPSSVLVGPDGRILMTHTGFRESDKAVLESRIAAALGGTSK
ncbi:TlpA family protein disulfide reductase [Noviherbaspirillum denitrificans]|uniref:Thiol:disulfide interchange protein n=1 Tax=Noviherbaspirillum denitrificans TaxID=1968433 RepID=A0A254TLA6_9BURK|nr:TlpA disulfide reductase family protein [Noviherbaspirillum denitrificans]OWW21393.1 thiol:disulfide interchange protein [Noviherbaspirillum denitrificans]